MCKVDKVGVTELFGIQPGETRTFVLPTGRSRASAQTQAYRMPLLHPRDGVSRYRCKTLQPTDGGFPIEITAETYEQE